MSSREVNYYHMRCSICKDDIMGVCENYLEFFNSVMTRRGWVLLQDKVGNLRPVCYGCSQAHDSLEDQEGEN